GGELSILRSRGFLTLSPAAFGSAERQFCPTGRTQSRKEASFQSFPQTPLWTPLAGLSMTLQNLALANTSGLNSGAHTGPSRPGAQPLGIARPARLGNSGNRVQRQRHLGRVRRSGVRQLAARNQVRETAAYRPDTPASLGMSTSSS